MEVDDCIEISKTEDMGTYPEPEPSISMNYSYFCDMLQATLKKTDPTDNLFAEGQLDETVRLCASPDFIDDPCEPLWEKET